MEGFDKTGNYETEWMIESDGPVYRSYRMRQPICNAVVELQIIFYHQLKKIDFNLFLNNWDGTMFREYRMAFPLNMKDGEVSYEVPYGVVEVGKDEMEGAAGERYTVPCSELHPRGIENWISASSGSFGFTLASSVVGVDYIDPTDKQPDYTILQPILLASRRSCHWEGNDYHQTGNHSYSFSVTSHNPGWQNGARFGRASNEQLYVIVNPGKYAAANLGESESFLSVREDNITITAMKKAENENGVVIRYYNCEDKETEVELNLWKSFSKAYSTNLIEEISHEIPLYPKMIRLKTGKRSIETVKLR
jgi:alpha-mannosidase